MVVISAISGSAAGWLTVRLQYRQERQLRQDDSAVASLTAVARALADLRVAYLRRATGGRRRGSDTLMTNLEAKADAAVTLTADEGLVRLVSEYKIIGRLHASRDPDTGVEQEAAAHETVASQIRESLRLARAT